jgi:hypothetical protein
MSRFQATTIATERIWKVIQEFGGSAAAGPTPKPAGGAIEADTARAEVPPTEPSESAAVRVEEQPSAGLAEPLASVGAQVPDVAPKAAKASKKATPAKNALKAKRAAKAQESAGPREGSKTAQVVAMLQRKNGATLAEIMSQMGWQKHTVRGFMAGTMKKAGYTFESFKPEGGERTYRINP